MHHLEEHRGSLEKRGRSKTEIPYCQRDAVKKSETKRLSMVVCNTTSENKNNYLTTWNNIAQKLLASIRFVKSLKSEVQLEKPPFKTKNRKDMVDKGQPSSTTEHLSNYHLLVQPKVLLPEINNSKLSVTSSNQFHEPPTSPRSDFVQTQQFNRDDLTPLSKRDSINDITTTSYDNMHSRTSSTLTVSSDFKSLSSQEDVCSSSLHYLFHYPISNQQSATESRATTFIQERNDELFGPLLGSSALKDHSQPTFCQAWEAKHLPRQQRTFLFRNLLQAHH